MADITSFMQSFIDSFVSMLTDIYNSLSNIRFFGISLLSYVIALFVLSAAVPIVISIVSGGYSTSKSYYRRSRRVRSERSQGDSDE